MMMISRSASTNRIEILTTAVFQASYIPHLTACLHHAIEAYSPPFARQLPSGEIDDHYQSDFRMSLTIASLFQCVEMHSRHYGIAHATLHPTCICRSGFA